MTDDWDFYALRVDGEPASIFVDLGIQSGAPLRSHPHLAYVRLHMRQPRADGLSSEEEFEALLSIERSLEANLCVDGACYVGRNTSNGCRDFYFYVSTANDWPDQVRRAFSSFDDYDYDAGTREDAGWSAYFEFLLPGKADRQKIENRRACNALEQLGDSLTAERDIVHWSYFRSQEAADAYVAEITPNGFRVEDRTLRGQGALRFGVRVCRADVPSYGNIDNVTLPLFEASARHGGEYDGWECPALA